MFQFIEKKGLDLLMKMFFGLLGVCTIIIFSGSLSSNYKEFIKRRSLNNQWC